MWSGSGTPGKSTSGSGKSGNSRTPRTLSRASDIKAVNRQPSTVNRDKERRAPSCHGSRFTVYALCRAAFERAEGRGGGSRLTLFGPRARLDLLLDEFKDGLGGLAAEGAALGFEDEVGHLPRAVAETVVARDEVFDDAALA